MKVRKGAKSDKIELQMTPMIDIVFQLLVFFIMTFNIVEVEGDFGIQLPGAPAQHTEIEVAPVKLSLRMTANDDGTLKSLTLDGTKMNSFEQLHQLILKKKPIGAGPASDDLDFEVEIQSDYKLKYENVIQAITAVRGKRQKVAGKDEIITLIDKIRFAQPVGGPEN